MRTSWKVAIGVTGLLAVGLTVAVASVWQPDRSVEQLTERWAPAPSKFLPLDGMSVHYRDEGPRDDPSPLVLLHGTSASLHTWQGWTSTLAADHRVVRMDLPGFGLTGPFADGDYTMAHYVRFLESFLDALGIPEAVVVGNSFGGNLAWHLAVQAPARVQKLVLIDASGYAYKPKSMPLGFRLAQHDSLRPLLERVLPRSTVESSVRNVYGDPSKVTPALIDRYFELTLRAGNRHALQERFKQVVSGQDSAQIAKIAQPTLILWGGSDALIPFENAEHFKRDIARSALVRLPGLGHVPHEEDPQASLAAAASFLARKETMLSDRVPSP